ncbi:MAG: M14 family zinc carboxypeptidase, partial [Pseudomonadota bacterium]
IVERLSGDQHRGATVELWVFDGRDRREAARDRLRARGVEAHIRCAYKPLVHVALEEIGVTGLKAMTIHYPVVAGVPENRFRLEAYPFADLTGDAEVRFEPADPVDGSTLLTYRLEMNHEDGNVSTLQVYAPNRFVTDPAGEKVLNPCGWLRLRSPSAPDVDEAFETDQERAFRTAMDTLADLAPNGTEPFFERLEIRVEAPFFDLELPVGHECLSTAEAMHEDLYFTALDVFKKARSLGLSDRTLRPGQVVPVLRANDGPLRVKLTTTIDPDLERDLAATKQPLTDLATAEHWLEPGTIKAHLDDLGGDGFEARSQRGRPVWGACVEGAAPNLMITAGQHANETTGPVGALRAAKHLVDEGQTGFCIAPLVNPDGYAVFRELCNDFPRHMNHAARFTASGCDLAHVERGFENEAHHMGRDRTGAELHMNLHGYPAHEWTRPFTGFMPRGAETWSLPRGFLLILLFWSGWEDRGRAILDAVIDALAEDPVLVDLNREQRERSSLYAGGFPLQHRKDIPYVIEEVPSELFPITIITEAPDETIDGDLFRLFHTAQMTSVLAAAKAARSVLA